MNTPKQNKHLSPQMVNHHLHNIFLSSNNEKQYQYYILSPENNLIYAVWQVS